jgi:hypothetical protein
MDSYTEWNRHLINDRYEWIIPARYTDLTPLGQGSFGLVWYVFIFISFIPIDNFFFQKLGL